MVAASASTRIDVAATALEIIRTRAIAAPTPKRAAGATESSPPGRNAAAVMMMLSAPKHATSRTRTHNEMRTPEWTTFDAAGHRAYAAGRWPVPGLAPTR